MFLYINESNDKVSEWINIILLILFVVSITFTISKLLNFINGNKKDRKPLLNRLVIWSVITVILGIIFFVYNNGRNDISMSIGVIIVMMLLASLIEMIRFIIKTIMADKKSRKELLHKLYVWIGILFICGALYAIFYASKGASDPWDYWVELWK